MRGGTTAVWLAWGIALGLCVAAGGSAPPPSIVAFGDSLTAGYGAGAGRSYPDYLQADLRAAGYAYRVINLGESGDTTTDGLARLGAVVAAHPALVILEFGGNDGLRGVPVAATRANLDAIIVKLQAAGLRILLVGMSLPPNYGPDYIQRFQAMFGELARAHHVALLPFLYENLVPQLKTNPGLLQEDGIHPTAAGNRIVAATVLRYVKPLLRKQNP